MRGNDATDSSYPTAKAKLVFPHSNDVISQPPQAAMCSIVATAVAVDLLPPERCARGRRSSGAARTGVPKTSINEDRQADARKEEIRPSWDIGRMLDPAGYTCLPQDLFDMSFGRSIPLGPDAGHPLGTVGWRERIDHLRCPTRQVSQRPACSPLPLSFCAQPPHDTGRSGA